MPQDDKKTSRGMDIIATYRKYFQLIFHEPLDLAAYQFDDVIATLKGIMDIADAYDSLAILTMPVDLYFRTVPKAMAELSRRHYQDLLQLAVATKSAFLFKEAGCRLIGDLSYSNEDVEANFGDIHPSVLPLLLGKRAALQSLMDSIEIGIFTIQAWPN